MPRENLTSLFGEFRHFARDVAIVHRRGYRREAWTYEKLAKTAVQIALELKKQNVRTGDRVLLWGQNSPEWVAAFWGCLLRGAVAVPLDEGSTLDFAARVVVDAQAKLILASREKRGLDTAVPRLVLEDFADSSRPAQPFATGTVPRGTSPAPYAALADEPILRTHIAQILYTSGTTAEPRGVVLTHGNFLANLEPLEQGIAPYRKYERWFHPLRFVSLVPLSHVFGQFMALFVPPLLAAAIVFENSNNPAEILRLSKKERATAIIAVPRMLDALRSTIERDIELHGLWNWFNAAYHQAENESFLRRAWRFRRMHRQFGWKFWAFISGGAALGNETEKYFKRLGFAVVQGYGMTETASLISLNHPFHAAEGSVGKILPGRECKLAEDGEILIRGENVSSAYWEKGARKASNESGWLKTGDIGEMDAQGNLKFRGRKKSVMVTPSGLNVHPEDLEAAIKSCPGIRDCVVVPLERNGNAEPCAVLLPLHPDNLTASAARQIADSCALAVQSANRQLAEYQRVRQWVVWPEPDFPRTATGKPRLPPIAARARQLLSLSTSSASSHACAGLLPGGEFAGLSSASLHDLTSLDRVELISSLEQRFEVEINEAQFAEAESLDEVRTLLAHSAGRRAEYLYPRWAQRGFVRFLRLLVYYALVWPATQILGHPRVVGRDRLRNLRGPVILVSNHITRRADIGLILAAFPSRFRHRLAIAMGGESLQRMRKPPFEWFFAKRWAYQLGYFLVTALFNVFPLPQLSGFRESFRFAGESVDRGYSVLIFPEGEVNETEDGRMAPFQSGIGLLAENLQLPIVPIRLDGVWQMKREHRRLARFGEITVHIGKPATFAPGTPPAEIAMRLEKIVREL